MNYVEKELIKLILLADILLKFRVYTNMQREKERRKNLE